MVAIVAVTSFRVDLEFVNGVAVFVAKFAAAKLNVRHIDTGIIECLQETVLLFTLLVINFFIAVFFRPIRLIEFPASQLVFVEDVPHILHLVIGFEIFLKTRIQAA